MEGEGEGTLEYYGSEVASLSISAIEVFPENPPTDLFIGSNTSAGDMKKEFDNLSVRGTAVVTIKNGATELLQADDPDPNLVLMAKVSWETGGGEELRIPKPKFHISRLVPKPSEGDYTIRDVDFEAQLK